MRLSTKSLEWAKDHISLFYDSDFYPKPFEFKSIWRNWDEVKDHLLSIDLSQFTVQQPIINPSPKPSNGFRIVHQLDPLDSIIYTALAFEIAEHIERQRIPVEDEVVFSYRINIKENGEFFSKGNGFTSYNEKSKELANEFKYILIADITDFYNQIYHHRLQNAIEICDSGLEKISKEIEGFLMKLSTKVSRGVPVGPAASIIMSEALLNDIDQFILQYEKKYVRYVDDIRIFANSEFELQEILYNLTKYLHTNHRLTLSSTKTKIISSLSFIKDYLENNDEIVKAHINKELEKLDVEVHDYADYQNRLESLPDDHNVRIQGEAFTSIMKSIVQMETLQLGLARHILRRSKRLQSKAILENVLINFDFFTPVIRDVVLYLEEITNEEMIHKSIPLFFKIISESKMVNLPFISEWVSYYFSTNKAFAKYKEIRDFVKNNGSIRTQALFAKTSKNIAWVRNHKTDIDQLGPWDRRAVIYSANILSKDEREKWLKPLEKKVGILEKCIIKDIINK